ncbi:unnamed protein product [Didymodactylos carnosus]|uniref:RH1 domain-containing protein n=1 Tax=Didymodactylos carnosus TaxID=1234261 RepID=A0A8S2EL68_9BILA|nr:unnamed protein product [Didymodactylos carnosus]CAF3989246.1 unnamed protein product [Didymodactylos carnosus]
MWAGIDIHKQDVRDINLFDSKIKEDRKKKEKKMKKKVLKKLYDSPTDLLPDLVSQSLTSHLTTSDVSSSTTSNRSSSYCLSPDNGNTIDVMRKMTYSSSPLRYYPDLTVEGVYDEAALIGKDFERIIELYGTDTIKDLVPKVIRILELLETQAAKNEKETDELTELKMRIEKLEMEKNETRGLREKFDKVS